MGQGLRHAPPVDDITSHEMPMGNKVETNPKTKILMVDDEPKNLLALESVLDRLGLDLVKAHSGSEALRCLIKDDFAAILLDVQMPDMDGFECASLVRSREKSRYSPIVFMTAVGKTEAEMFKGYEAGAVDYLLKPFSPEVLRHKVAILVELFEKTSEIRRLNGELKSANALLERRVSERTATLELRGVELLRSNQELAQFAAVASHDLQEPLRTLSTYLQLVREANLPKFNDEDKGFMEVVLDSAKRMRQLINDLLAFSQLGQVEMKVSRVDCALLVSKTVKSLMKVIEDSGAKIEVGKLPIVTAEPVLLGQVFQNLIENALKFHVKVPPLVEVNAKEAEGMWIFSVRDNGIGILPEYFEKIFKLFQRLHTRDDYPGTGLGLSICKKAVERQGGRIWVESVPGQGATFFFSIPALG
jgi:two-component system sensor histidine kinase/response regulator